MQTTKLHSIESARLRELDRLVKTGNTLDIIHFIEGKGAGFDEVVKGGMKTLAERGNYAAVWGVAQIIGREALWDFAHEKYDEAAPKDVDKLVEEKRYHEVECLANCSNNKITKGHAMRKLRESGVPWSVWEITVNIEKAEA